MESLPDNAAATTVVAAAATVSSAPTELASDAVAASSARGNLHAGAAVGRYLVLASIGAGGMGVVCSAYDPELGRKVALKLIRNERGGGEAGTEARARFLREGQAMARLAHPNVVAVYDVGSFGDEAFIAMELVEGETLREWIRHGNHTLREKLEAFVAAGRGLAAAHEAGLVHRDFKPDNVLVGRDGRVRVADFGLVHDRLVAGRPPAAPVSDAPFDARDSDSALTVAGAVMGTPLYMAPEQHDGRAVDAQADQFSFCAALYEGLTGRPPFAGKTLAELRAEIAAGNVLPLPRGVSVPAHVWRAVLRGLSTEPTARFPSMNALLLVLAPPRRTLRRRWVILAASAALATLAVVVGLELRERRAQMCRGAEAKLSGVWDDAAKRAVRDAFLKTARPFAADAWQRVSVTLDAYATEWVAMHADACRATRVHEEQSEAMLDLRIQCLERPRDDLRALVRALSTADLGVAERALAAARGLTPISRCADLAALATGTPLPLEDALRAGVKAARQATTRAEALRYAGKFTEGIAAANEAVALAKRVGYAPVIALAMLALGRLRSERAEIDAADQALTDAFFAAETARDDRLKAEITVELVHHSGQPRSRDAQTRTWHGHGRATLARVGGDARLALPLDRKLGNALFEAGKLEEAAALFERNRRALVASASPDPIETAATLNNLAVTLTQLGRYKSALEHQRESLANFTRLHGPAHPDVAMALSNLATGLLGLGNDKEGIAAVRRALALREAALGPLHFAIADSLYNLGVALSGAGENDEAVDLLRRAIEMIAKTRPPEHPLHALARLELGSTLATLGRFAEARTLLREGLELARARLGAEHKTTGRALAYLGEVLGRMGDRSEGIALLRQGLAVQEKAQGQAHAATASTRIALADLLRAGDRGQDVEESIGHYTHAAAAYEKSGVTDLASPLTGLGRAYLKQGQLDRALSTLERALSLRKAQGASAEPADIATTQFALARALVRSGRDLSRARAIAAEALAGFPKGGPAHRDSASAVQRWLAKTK